MVAYLSAELYGGLCNKVFCLMSAIEIAMRKGYVFIEPMFGWQTPVKMSLVWNIDKFLAEFPGLKFISLDSFNALGPAEKAHVIHKNKRRLWLHQGELMSKHFNTRTIRTDALLYKLINCLEPAKYLLDAINIEELRTTTDISVHFRIEDDWVKYADKKQTILSNAEHCLTSVDQIINMLDAEFGHDKTVFFTSGQQNKHICDALHQAGFGVKTIPYNNNLEYEQNGALNWYLCSLLGTDFVGLSRSTFSNLICLKSLCLGKGADTEHWVYNLGGRLEKRKDAGLFADPEQAICIAIEIVRV